MSLRKQRVLELEELLTTYSTKGYQTLQEEHQSLLDVAVATAADQCPTNDLWQQRRGEIATLRHVIGMEGQVRWQLDHLDDMVFDDEALDNAANELED
jgi:hypothetical protein